MYLHKRNVKRRIAMRNANGDATVNGAWY
jgi:hypothetical protein